MITLLLVFYFYNFNFCECLTRSFKEKIQVRIFDEADLIKFVRKGLRNFTGSDFPILPARVQAFWTRRDAAVRAGRAFRAGQFPLVLQGGEVKVFAQSAKTGVHFAKTSSTFKDQFICVGGQYVQ